ncbi:LAME_0F07294g1_1 [Lachancea meyersii CBS 8951]|uniref:LAME_0F07294g1_1 n=1 Tax=Lachancea meyersii CBS 8951 TaxID=1266667 RepID=A0A1G4JTZ2_9SACH|nr:LAME_0F07294g1_1 [Lachancea meyersii CBS 8951]
MASTDSRGRRSIEKRVRTSSSIDADSLAPSSEPPADMARPNKRARNYGLMTQTQDSSQALNGEDANASNWLLPGYIKCVRLRDFMCHKNFHLKLGSKLNFIIGSNGSGKSAILTAITVGLGAKATDTSRGSNLKEFIREGCSSARVEIVLSNEGFGSYGKDTYGSEITIARTIKKDGPAAFAIKDESGRIVSTKRRDLQAITDHFSIPVMNPMCFLSQDAARSFLTASTPADKYKHFMRATLLEDTEANLQKAEDTSQKAEDYLIFHAKSVKVLRKEYEDSRRLLEGLRGNQELSRRKKHLQGRLLWLSIAENEKKLHKLQKNGADYQEKIDELDRNQSRVENKIERYNVDQSASEEDLMNAQTKLQEKKQIAEDVRSKLNQIKLDYEAQIRNRTETETLVEQAKCKIRNCNNNINHLEEQLRRQAGGDKKGIERKLTDLQNEMALKDESLLQYSEQLRTAMGEAKELKSNAEKTKEDKERTISFKQRELQNVISGKQNFLFNFDPKMDKVVQVIKRQQFSVPPIGPLGAYVTVKPDFREWTKCIQAYLGNNLGAFVVANGRDSDLLKKILNSHGLKHRPNIITRKFEEFDYSRGKPKIGYPTIVDALEFSAGTEFVLVDVSSIEKILLIKNKDEAMEVLRSSQNANVNRALSIIKENRFLYFLSTKSQNSLKYRGPLRMMTKNSSDDDISYLKRSIHDDERGLAEFIELNRRQLAETQDQINSILDEISSIKSSITEMGRREASLRIELETEIDMGAIEQMQDEKRSYEEAISSYSLTIEEINDRLGSINREAQHLRQSLSEARSQVQESESSLQALKDSCSLRDSNLSKLREDDRRYTQELQRYKEHLEENRRKQDEFNAGIQRQIPDAVVFCSRAIAFGEGMPETKEDTNAELEEVSHRIQDAERRAGISQDQVYELFQKAKMKKEDAERKYSEVDNLIRHLKKSLEKRGMTLNLARADTYLNADTDFRNSLQERNFSGSLDFDYDEKTLNMLMKTPNDDCPRNVDTFSGGEKSFAQTSLLLATWRPMRSRIIALDEFDVYMDQVNRREGTKLIVSKYSRDERTQTIIITPQDIGKMANLDNPEIFIHKMSDPERRNNSS